MVCFLACSEVFWSVFCFETESRVWFIFWLCISQFQAPTSPPGRPPGFALYCSPGAGIYTWWPSPGTGFLHIHKITFSTVKKYTFTQLAFGSYLHALHRQFRLDILAWLNTKILKWSFLLSYLLVVKWWYIIKASSSCCSSEDFHYFTS